MSDYISRDAAIEAVCGGCNEQFDDEPCEPSCCSIRERLKSIPASDVRPAVRARWIAEKEDVEWGNSTVRYRCSHCKRLPHFDKETYKFILSDFCPNCGADMGGK